MKGSFLGLEAVRGLGSVCAHAGTLEEGPVRLHWSSVPMLLTAPCLVASCPAVVCSLLLTCIRNLHPLAFPRNILLLQSGPWVEHRGFSGATKSHPLPAPSGYPFFLFFLESWNIRWRELALD